MNLSVIIPLYNKKNEIKATIESVLRQTVSDFELIVVDDGSTDGSYDKVVEISDERICLIRQPNQGVSAARNTGIHMAKGELLLFLDADDLWEPFFIEEILNLRSRFPQAGIYATAYRFYTNGNYSNPKYKYIDYRQGCQILDNYFKANVGSPPVWSSAVAIPKFVFSTIGKFVVGMRNGEDLDMWARIALKYPVAWSPRPCVSYNLSADNRCAGKLTNTDDISVNYLDEQSIKNKWLVNYIVKRRTQLAITMILHNQYKNSFILMMKNLSLSKFNINYLRYMWNLFKALIASQPRADQ